MKVHPKRAKQIWTSVLKFVAIVITLMLILAAIQYKRTAPINELTVVQLANEKNQQFIQEEDIRDLLFQKFGNYMEGQPANKVPVSEIETALEQNLFIKKADVYVDAWNNLNIAVEQRVPLFRVKSNQGEDFYIDQTGAKVPTSIKYSAHTLVVTGDVGLYVDNYLEVEENSLRQIYELVSAIHKDPFLDKQIDHIHIDQDNQVFLIPKVGDHQIIFGEMTEDIQDKFDRLKIFYQQGLPYEGWEKYKLINLAYRGQIITKRR